MNLIIIVFALAIFLATLKLALKKKIKKNKTSIQLIAENKKVYAVNEYLLTGHERTFLENFLKPKFEGFLIHLKVRVVDALNTEKNLNYNEKLSAFRQLSQWHFDFLITDKKYKIIAAVELDDKSHDTEKRKRRDAILNNACKNAGLKLYRFRQKGKSFVEN